MPITRNTLLPQHNLSGGHYGALPLAGLPTGTATGDIFYFSGSNWIVTPLPASGAPSAGDYLVGTAQAGLSSEIVVGTTPNGELGGTWGAITVDATHAGSAHHVENHAARHDAAAADPLRVETLSTSSLVTTWVLSPTGAGGVQFRAETGGTGDASRSFAFFMGGL